MPLMNALKNVMLNEEVDIKVINYLKSFAKSMGFMDTLFVSTAGDNSDGSSWQKAYTSLVTALDWISSNQSTGESHLIMIGDGSFDINTTGDPTYTSLNIALIGMGKNKTWLYNSHASATSILYFDGCALTIAGLTFYTVNSNIEGLHLDDSVGSFAGNGTVIEDVDFRVLTPTGAHTLLYMEGSIEKLQMKNCDFYGNVTHTTAIYTDDATYNHYENIHLDSCLMGIRLNDADDKHNYFKDIYFSYCATCIQIDNAAADGNHFENIYFDYTYTANIVDNAGLTYYNNLHKNGVCYEAHEEYLPADLTGVTVTAGVGANTYAAADTEIVPAASATAPYLLLGFAYECAATEKYAIRFIQHGGTGYALEIIVEGTANVLKDYYFEKPVIIPQGIALDASIKSETGSNNMLVWAIIEMF